MVCYSSSVRSGYGVNYSYGSIPRMDYVVGDYEGMPVEDDMPVEIAQDEESGEEEPGAPEWIRNPRVQGVVRGRRRVIRNDRRSIIIVIVVDDLRGRTGDVIRYRRFGRPYG